MLHALLMRFGLPALFVGAGVEGEPFAIAGGLLAHRAIVPLWAAVLLAVAGAFAIDLFWFTLARRARAHRWVQAASRRPGFAKSTAMIERHAVIAIPLFRFAYGIRAVAPVAVGVSRVSTCRFVLLDLAAAAAWGTVFTLIGYGFGATLSPWIGHLAIFGGLLGAVLLIVPIVDLARHRSGSASQPHD